jgi:hypothetical protein
MRQFKEVGIVKIDKVYAGFISGFVVGLSINLLFLIGFLLR